MRILLIDDDKDEQLIFSEAVGQVAANMQFETADDGVKGLQRLEEDAQLPDVIFLDINMPLMGGKEMLQVMRTHREWDRVAVIMYSTSQQVGDKVWAQGYNAQFVTKPYDFGSMVTLLSRVLNNGRLSETVNA